MGRKIILLSDGTGNSSAKVWRTNVWRTFEALDLSGSDQVAYYDDGVGTSSFKPLAILGGVFGFGLKRNVIAIYKFACRNYRGSGDEFFGFGFSRGAFTIRIVMGLILSEGIVQADNESDLHRAAVDKYRAYRRKKSHTRWRSRPEDKLRDLRDACVQTKRRLLGQTLHPAAKSEQNIHIRFIGVWDTVSAYGLPIDEMTRGVSHWIWPLALPDYVFDPARVSRGCHALSLDEERTTFHPELWSEGFQQDRNEPVERERAIDDQQLSQVWFAGVHSNVGGGYPDDSLAYVSLTWMLTEAKKCGLNFKSDYNAAPPAGVVVADPDTFKYYRPKADKDGRIYDPRKGIGGYYRYGPRKVVDICTPRFRKHEDDEIVVNLPKIHESVFARIDNHAHAYAPIGLPAIYDIVTQGGEVLTPDQFHSRPPYLGESNQQATARALAQEHVWNEVWKRRLVYFGTLLTTFSLLLMPFVTDPELDAESKSSVRWVSDAIRLVGHFLPNVAQSWIASYALQPILFLVVLSVLCVWLYLGSYYAARVNEIMGLIWRRASRAPAGEPTNRLYRLRNSDVYQQTLWRLKRRWAPAFFAILFAVFALQGINKTAFEIADTAGWTCTPSSRQMRVETGQPTIADIDISRLCQGTGINLEGNGARYRLTLFVKNGANDQWRDWYIPIPPGGFVGAAPDPDYFKKEDLEKPNHLIESAPWWFRTMYFFAIPLRRDYTLDWFRLIARVGRVGASEDFYRPDPHDNQLQWIVRPKSKGELFVYVNDAVLIVPGLFKFFYSNNSGFGKLCIQRLPEPRSCRDIVDP